MLKRAAAIAAACLAFSLPVAAGEYGDIAREHLYAGTPDAGLEALSAVAASQTGGEQAFAEGLMILAKSMQDLSQALYRHGFGAPETGPMGPALAVPIPQNPNPEPLDYAKFRAILEAFDRALSDASDRFGYAGETAMEEGDFKVVIDPLKVRLDVDGDGTAGEAEILSNVLMSGLRTDTTLPPVAVPPSRTQSGAPASPDAASGTEIAFDTADAFWLSGYASLLHAQTSFLLAHDFSTFFNAVGHRFFPSAGLPMEAFSRGGQLVLDPESDTAIADAIAAIHTINWPVVDKEKLHMVQYSLHVVVDTSRQNWEAILAETDDDRELLPGPKQTALDGSKAVTQEMVDAWHATLSRVEEILQGKLLIPHWRFKQGFDLKAYFDTAERTDFVMLLSGYDALPFLKDGPIATAESFAEANRVFGDNLFGYAFWFN